MGQLVSRGVWAAARRAIVGASALLALAAHPRSSWGLGDGRSIHLDGQLTLAAGDPAMRVRFKDRDGQEWVVVGPYKNELERLAQDAPGIIRISAIYLHGTAQALISTGRTCVNAGRMCGETSAKRPTLVVDKYLMSSVLNQEALAGVLQRPAPGWLQVGQRPYTGAVRFPEDSYPAWPLRNALGCRVWIAADSPDGFGTCHANEVGDSCFVTAQLAKSGVLRCGPDPASASAVARPTGLDWLVCDLEHPRTRWYCHLRDSAETVRKTIPAARVVDGEGLSVAPVLEPMLRQETLLLPRLGFTLNWVDTPICRKLALIHSTLDVKVGSVRIGTVHPGQDTYEFSLGASSQAAMWKRDKSGQFVTEAPVSFEARNPDAGQYVRTSPPGYIESLPAECALALSDLRLGFDDAAIKREIYSLGQRALAHMDVLAARLVIHSQYLRASRGALCAVDRVANAAIETLGDLSTLPTDLASLPVVAPSAHFVITAALDEARYLGALPANATDAWAWFLANHFAVHQQCAPSSSIDDRPSEAAFASFRAPLRQQGIDNARAFLRDEDTFRALQKRAWALAGAIGASVDTRTEHWMSFGL